MTALGHQLVSPWNIFNLPDIGRDHRQAAGDRPDAPTSFLELGWVKFRARRTLAVPPGRQPAVIGGQDVLVSSPQNAAVLGMFLGKQAPQHTAAARSTARAARCIRSE